MCTIIKVNQIQKEYLCHSFNNSTNTLNIEKLQIEKGKFVGILGISGSGKSTLAKLLVGLIQPDSGEIYLNFSNSEDLKNSEVCLTNHLTNTERTALRRKSRYIFQSPEAALNPEMSVRGILNEALKISEGRIDKVKAEQRIREQMAKVYLSSKFLDKYPRVLSTGQKRKVSLARALLTSPELIIADEPLSGLDLIAGRKVIEVFKALKAESKTILLITHDYLYMKELCDQIIIIDGGRISDIMNRSANGEFPVKDDKLHQILLQ